MGRYIKNMGQRAGEAPGTLVHIGDIANEKIQLTLIEYNKEHSEKKELNNVEECFQSKNNENIKWVNVEGIHDISIIEKIGKEFNLNYLMLEDILNTGQRPKLDDYDDYLFAVLKMLYYDEKRNEIIIEQVSFVLVSNYVFSFQEFEGDVFEAVRERIKAGKGNIRKLGPDYLLYALIDAIVDSYFFILEKVGDNTEDIEEELMLEPRREVLQNIYKVKREMIFLRNSIWPLREVVGSLSRCESSLIKENTGMYLRDVYDHTIQIIDTIESYRDIASGMLDTYLSSISNKTNDVMKVLTIFSTIFIPLTFIAGIYGMNFQYMPELSWKWSYLVFWIITIIVMLSMLSYFRRKKWL